MLFILDESLRQASQQQLNHHLDGLMLSHRRGDHLVSGSLSTINFLIGVTAGHIRDTLCKIKSRCFELRAYMDAVDVLAFVTFGNPHKLSPQPDPTIRTFEIELCVFANNEHAPVSLIVENLNDGYLLNRWCLALIAHNGWANITASFHILAGGGNATAQTFAHERNLHLSIAIVDSDRKHPGDKLGDTADRLREEGKCAARLPSDIVILQGRELENLLPSEMVVDLQIANDSPAFHADLKTLATTLSCDPHFAAYIDCKCGLTLSEVFDATGAYKTFLSNSSTTTSKQRLSACTASLRKCSSSIDCSCRVTPALGSSLLQRAITYSGRLSPHKLGEILFSDKNKSKQHLEGLLRRIVSWGVCSKKSRT